MLSEVVVLYKLLLVNFSLVTELYCVLLLFALIALVEAGILVDCAIA